MGTARVTTDDRERYARARALGALLADAPSAVTAARYLRDRDAIQIEFKGGGIIIIPRHAIHEVARARTPALDGITVSLDAIHWRALDVDISVPGLVERVFGARLFAASTGHRGGRKRSKAKAAAARLNGAKGGRPRKGSTG